MTDLTQGKRKKPRTCPHCSREFRRHEHLLRHLRIHTNEKPYGCACGALFARRDLLKRHESLAHSASIGGEQTQPQTQTQIQTQLQTPADTDPGTVHGPDPDPGSNSNPGEWLQPETLAAVYEADDPFQDFEQLSRSLGFTTDWNLSEPDFAQFMIHDFFTGQANAQTGHGQSGRGQAIQPHVQSGQGGQGGHGNRQEELSQLPVEKDSVAEFGVLTFPDLKVTEDHRTRLVESLQRCQSPIGDSAMPSCHSLTRFVNAFFDGFYPHVPMVHIPTFKVEDCTPEILLAMAALGAQYRHEHRKGALMFFASKAIFHRKLQDREDNFIQRHISEAQTPALTPPPQDGYKELMRSARCAYYLIAFATWQREPEIFREAFNLTGFLARSIRESGLDERNDIHEHSANTTDWHAWVEQESNRRVKLFSFTLLNLHSVAFNLPAGILVDEIQLRLPSGCMEWLAPCQEKWAMIRSAPGFQEQLMLPDALDCVFHHDLGSGLSSPLANYILIHALIQRILLLHRVFPRQDIQKEDIRNALRSWTNQWQKTPESSLDPRNPNGPVTFTSTALLGLAYVRLAFDMWSSTPSSSVSSSTMSSISSSTLTWNAEAIATHLRSLPPLPHSPHLLPAVLHATHALSIPVKLGVDFVVRCHAYSWSIQHSLCGVEFAVFLSKWLFCISTKEPSEHESRLITWLSDIIEEGRTSGDSDLCAGPVSPTNCAHMAFAAVKLWARLIRGNTQWAGVGVLGDALDMYAGVLSE